MGKVKLIIQKPGVKSGLEISELVEKIVWSGRKGSPVRTLKISLLDDDGYRHDRSGIDIEDGWQCVFFYGGKERFRGIFLNSSQSEGKTASFTAYDLGIYLSNNKDTFVYENKTAAGVFKDVCDRFGIPVGSAAKTSYLIPDLVESKKTGWDAIADALQLDYENTGEKHYVFAEGGKLYLKKRLENMLQWVLEPDTNITSYTYEKSLGEIKTRVKVLSKEGTVLAQAKDRALEKKIGIFQEIETPKESLSSAQVKTLVNSLLEEKKTPQRSLRITDAVGIPEVISGVSVFVRIPHLGIKQTFYVDSDVHTFTGNLHTMSLALNLIQQAQDKTEEERDSSNCKVGDIVWFLGGEHYVSSTAQSPSSAGLSAGYAKITLHREGAAHPWHLVTEDWSATHVWGWVDEGTFIKN